MLSATSKGQLASPGKDRFAAALAAGEPFAGKGMDSSRSRLWIHDVQGLGVAAHRELLHREMRVEALRRHARAADPREQHRLAASLERSDQVRGKLVPGGLAGHHADAQRLAH